MEPAGWNPPPPQHVPTPSQHPSLSVITTVWGVSTTQTPPVPVHSQSNSTSFATQHMSHHGGLSASDQMRSNYNYGGMPSKTGMPGSYHSSHVFPHGHRSMNGPGRYTGGPVHHMGAEQVLPCTSLYRRVLVRRFCFEV